MNTILTVVLQISGGLRTEVNSFLSEYAVPVNGHASDCRCRYRGSDEL